MTKKTNDPITLDALPPGSVVELQGKQYPTHPGLLALAHAHGVETITTDLLQYNDGEAILKAKVTGTRGTFEAHGDASPSNVSRNIANAVIRMAETRAVNRCLRLYLGIGATTAEELPPDAFQGRSGGNTRKAPSKPRQREPSPAASAAKSAVANSQFGKGDIVTTSKGNTGKIFWIGGDNGDRIGVSWGDGEDDKEWTYLRFCSAPKADEPPADMNDDEIPF
jgi:hypothetical protein|tara:strand:+ start:2089 stop:2757 length:669 start_codon:yes stop_codon:yes gene_type:complete